MIDYTNCIVCGDDFDYPILLDTDEQIANFMNDYQHPDDIPIHCDYCFFEPDWLEHPDSDFTDANFLITGR